MSRYQPKSKRVLEILNEIEPTEDIPRNMSPKDAAMFTEDTKDGHEPQPETPMPRCQESGKVCYPSKKVATTVARRVQKKRNTFLRVYFCETCKHHHLSSKRP